MAELRSTAQRKADVLAMLEGHPHAWLATASGSVPHVIVTQAVWDGESIVVATRQGSRTARNLVASKLGRLAFGDADDAILVDVELVKAQAAADGGEIGATFASGAGWNPAEQGNDWWLFDLRPTRIQAYRGYGEIEGRDVMKMVAGSTDARVVRRDAGGRLGVFAGEWLNGRAPDSGSGG